MEDIYDLNRFLEAQETQYAQAFSEVSLGKKKTHWIWYIFPQIVDLGTSTISRTYSLKSKEEVLAYDHHPVLGERLLAIGKVLLTHQNKSIISIFGHPEYLKIWSSISLFHLVVKEEKLFKDLLVKYFSERIDDKTLSILSTL